MSEKKVVSIVVSESQALTMPRITIEGKVDGKTVYTAKKTGEVWYCNLSEMDSYDTEIFFAIQEVMAQVNELVKQNIPTTIKYPPFSFEFKINQ